jgi:hypothetical protein
VDRSDDEREHARTLPEHDARARRDAAAMLTDTLRARTAAREMLAANAAMRARIARRFTRRSGRG